MENQNQPDVLDMFRGIDQRIAAQVLFDVVEDVKKKAREILEWKRRSELQLVAVGMKQEDVKRIIDYVNERPETKLSDERVVELEKQSKQWVEGLALSERRKYTSNGNAPSVGVPLASSTATLFAVNPDRNSSSPFLGLLA